MAVAPMSVGPYALLEPLGRGGWAEVFRARDPGGREVALKRPLPGVALSRERAARFRREGDVVRALDDPGIVRLLDAGEEGGRPWLAYELVQGARPLDAAMADAPTRERVRLVRDAARALGAAHAQGVVHRDVTPANVLVDAAGWVRVADFGLASMAGLDPLTASGVVVGTPGFLAPELALAGRDATSPRCDVWSLGVLLFVALTGRHPFQGVSFYDLVQRASAAPPSPRSVRPSVCADLDRACAAALAVDPAARPSDGAAFAALLGPCLARPCLDDDPAGPPALRVAASDLSSGAGTPTTPLGAPTRFGRYTATAQLGRGGMGTVHRAHDPELGRDVAVKVLDERRVSETDRARFAREAEVAAAVRHPNLVAVHEAGLADGRPYLVMDLVEGESLEDRLTRGPLPAREAARLVALVARALAALHAARIVHRDVKPANILVDRDGAPRLTDFGLAKLLDDRERLTRSQQVLGTALYMAPEQWGRAAVDERTDVYALGATLFALLTGDAPDADAESLQVLMARRLAGPPAPPSSVVPGVPPDLDRIALACQAVEPAERFATAGALAAALEAFLAGERVDAPLLPRRARPVGLLVAVAAVAVVAVVTVVARGGPGGGPSAEPGAAARKTLLAILASTGRLAAVSTEALAALRAAPAGPEGDEARALAGLVTLARGSPELAATFLPPPDRPAGPVAQGLRGALLAARPDGDPVLAARDLGAALDAGVRPVDLRAWRARARARGPLDAGLAAEVVRDLEAAAQAGGADLEEETALCLALLAAERVDEARAALARLPDPPADLAGRVGLALAARALAAGDAVVALAALGPLPGDARAEGAVHAQAARVACALLGRWTAAPPPGAEVEQVLAALRLAARLRPDDPYPPELRRSLLTELSRYDREVPGLLFPTVASAAPPDAALCWASIRTAVGVDESARGQYLPALERLLALGAPPDEWGTVVYMHAETLVALRRYPEAVAACDRALAAPALSGADEASRLRYIRGQARLGLAHYDEALADFDGAVLRSSMGRSDLPVRRAEALRGLGRRAEAVGEALAFIHGTAVDSSNVGGVPGLGRAAALLWSCRRDEAGRLAELRLALERVVQVYPMWGGWELRLALLELEAGETDRARARLEALRMDRSAVDDRALARRIVTDLRLVELVGADRANAVVELTRAVDALDRGWGSAFHP